uniref:PUTATIVE 2'-O-METHYL TRANSFERASE n=1 Tax=Ackermannviridae sp. TaxID=2831612 RepID=A0A8S5RQN4_9CAUD|nr:MAG TPA: PUTATIVE 2'-O-METHYL TRANSFERASE [Ackermannviridae sp.]
MFLTYGGAKCAVYCKYHKRCGTFCERSKNYGDELRI